MLSTTGDGTEVGHTSLSSASIWSGEIFLTASRMCNILVGVRSKKGPVEVRPTCDGLAPSRRGMTRGTGAGRAPPGPGPRPPRARAAPLALVPSVFTDIGDFGSPGPGAGDSAANETALQECKLRC